MIKMLNSNILKNLLLLAIFSIKLGSQLAKRFLSPMAG
jgi:hypothetical protein